MLFFHKNIFFCFRIILLGIFTVLSHFHVLRILQCGRKFAQSVLTVIAFGAINGFWYIRVLDYTVHRLHTLTRTYNYKHVEQVLFEISGSRLARTKW